MEYDEEADVYTCRNDKKLKVHNIRHSISKTGYVSEKTIYKYENWITDDSNTIRFNLYNYRLIGLIISMIKALTTASSSA